MTHPASPNGSQDPHVRDLSSAPAGQTQGENRPDTTWRTVAESLSCHLIDIAEELKIQGARLSCEVVREAARYIRHRGEAEALRIRQEGAAFRQRISDLRQRAEQDDENDRAWEILRDAIGENVPDYDPSLANLVADHCSKQAVKIRNLERELKAARAERDHHLETLFRASIETRNVQPPPTCSICRRSHGREIVHAAE